MTELTLPGRTYRIIDIATKLVGVALLAAAINIGIASTLGLGLALVGALFGVSTVFVYAQ